MKIGILKETKNPIDNRVALTPGQIKKLKGKYPKHSFVVQASDIRAYSDDEYRAEGVEVRENIDDCDFLLGIKEADIDILRPNKHYMFFGHIAKMQSYNKPLFKALLDRNITFSDYEYLVDDNNQRLVAFGWFAGVIGVYYTLRGYGLRQHSFNLPKPTHDNTVEDLIEILNNTDMGNIKIAVTGTGRVSQGAQYLLDKIKATRLSPEQYLSKSNTEGLNYCVLGLSDLVANSDNKFLFDHEDFLSHTENYHSLFMPYAQATDLMISAHFWNNGQPVYLSKEDLRNPELRIKIIGDITCDIQGSIKSTVRSSTHDKPYFDYNPHTECEEEAFSSPTNISVMAVDTCPNALPRVTSEYFGEKLIEFVLDEMLSENTDTTEVMERATIVKKGQLGRNFQYLSDYVKTL